MKLTHPTMARSDTEDIYEPNESGSKQLACLLQVNDSLLDVACDNTIHSGHFMVSHVHDETTAGPENDEKMDDDIESSAAKERLERRGQILQTSQAESGKRRNSATDSTLSNLFQCLNLVKDSRYIQVKYQK